MEGPSRRGLSGILVACVLAASGLLAVARADTPAKQTGTFALYKGEQQTIGEYWGVPLQPPGIALKVDQLDMHTKMPLLNYRILGGKQAHFFVIRDDFGSFNHFAADYNLGTGTLSTVFEREPGHNYWLFTDSHPVQMHRQVYRYTINDPSAPVAAPPSMAASPTTVPAGSGYTVNFDTTTLKAGQEHLLLVVVDKNGKAAEDLTPEFGGAAFMIVVNVKTLQYVSTHPMLRGQKLVKHPTYSVDQELDRLQQNSQVGPNQQVELPGLPAGTYKAWYEFIGGISQNYHVAPFTIVVQ